MCMGCWRSAFSLPVNHANSTPDAPFVMKSDEFTRVLPAVVAGALHISCPMLVCNRFVVGCDPHHMPLLTDTTVTAKKHQAEGMEEQQGREYVRRFARRSWPQFWFSMVRHNVHACVTDIREGIRTPGSGQYRRYDRPPQVNKPGRAGARTGRGWQVRICGAPCGVSSAPTLPVPASYPNSCISRDEWKKHSRDDPLHGGYGGGDGKRGHQDQQPAGKWTLPPKLRAAGRGAGSWGGETMMISSRSTYTLKPPSPTGPDRRRGGDSEAPTGVGSMPAVGQSCGIFHGTASVDQRGVGRSRGEGRGWLGGGSASGCGAMPSVFSPSPIPVDEPRKKSYDGTGRSCNNLQHGGSSGDVGGLTRGRGRGENQGPSGGGLTTIFSTPPIAMDEPRKNVYHMRGGDSGGRESTSCRPGGEMYLEGAGGEEEEEREGASSGGGASGRGLFTNASFTLDGLAEEESEERSSAGGASKANSISGG